MLFFRMLFGQPQNPVIHTILWVCFICYGIYLLFISFSRRKKYKLDASQKAWIQKMYMDGIQFVIKENEKEIKMIYSNGKMVKSWHPAVVKFFEFMKVNDYIELYNYIDRERR